MAVMFWVQTLEMLFLKRSTLDLPPWLSYKAQILVDLQIRKSGPEQVCNTADNSMIKGL